MRRWLLVSLAVWLAFGAGAALADVTVTATIDKTKDKTVVETITKDKNVRLEVDVIIPDAEKFAESETIVNQTNENNFACENCAEKLDVLSNSGNDNSGVLTINQSAGNLNNQGSAISIAVDVEENGNGADPFSGFAESQAAVDQENTGNEVDSINILFREARFLNSINDNSGVVHVNQSPGQMNNQVNALSMAVALDRTGGVALSEADLGQVNAENLVAESNVAKTAQIAASVSNNSGVIGVNQSSGSMANQANVVSVAVVAVQ